MAALSKEEYLKRYLSKSDSGAEKKRKKKVKTGVKPGKSLIIDDDVNLSDIRIKHDDEGQGNLLELAEEKPLIFDEDGTTVLSKDLETIKKNEEARKAMWAPMKDLTEEDRFQSPHSSKVGDASLTSTRRNEEMTRRKRHDSLSPETNKGSGSLELSPARNTRSNSPKVSREKSKSVKSGGSRVGGSPPRMEAIHDLKDMSPPRRRTQQNSEDMSPPRRKTKDNSNDLSPTRKAPHGSADMSPPRRRTRHDSEDMSPPRRKTRHDSEDMSPPRRTRHDSGDISPPRRQTRHDSEDMPPPRKGRHDSSSDQSPPRRNKSNTKHNSPDLSPPRKPSNLKGNPSSNQSPPRKKDSSNNHGAQNKRIRRDSPDQSPPRQKKTKDHGSDVSYKKEKDMSPKQKESAKHVRKAGLHSGAELRRENQVTKRRETEMFSRMSSSATGEGAETVHRDKEGRKRDLTVEKAKKKEEERKKLEEDEKFMEWGKGLQQTKEAKDKVHDDVYEMSKPLARYQDDKDLDSMLRDRDRAGDPMLAFMQKKRVKQDATSGRKEKPKYKGPAPPPNRFNLQPGYRWDGVDRSNGFEKKRFTMLANKGAAREEAYKWSTEDM